MLGRGPGTDPQRSTGGPSWEEPEGRPEVAIFLQDLAGGGAERSMVNLANGLAGGGFRVDLVLSRKEGPYLSKIDPAVRLVDLGAKRVMTVFLPLAAYLRRERPRVLLSTLVHVNVTALLARRVARVPVPVIIREASHMTSNRRNMGHFPVRVAYRLAPVVYPLAERILAVSEGVADDAADFLRLPRERIEVAYNPVVGPDLYEAASRSPDHPWFDQDAPPVFLNVGRLIEQKDQVTLLRAFAHMRSTREMRLIILGEGPLRGALEDLATSLGVRAEVAFPGFVNNPFSYMARATCFVLSSRWEGLPGALIQAMACGAPVVATDCPSGPAEILEGGKFGSLVPVGDDEAMAAAMETVLENPRERDGARSRAAEFSVEAAVTRYARIIAELARKQSP
jgi:glycosyltransferase involved in cell wall biosynthesis